MTFPISVKYNRPLKATITPDNEQQVLQYIEKSILEDKADNVAIQSLYVTYKGSTSSWNWALFKGIDNGTFRLFYKNNCWFLNYQINMRKLFIYTLIMSAIMGAYALLYGGPWWVGIAAFCWLCGGNWLINIVRHGGVASDIAFGIDELFGDQLPPESEEDKERLKSWF